ncbi:MAG: TIGR01777 family oxidoreductase [Bdellovibrionia bacterium]
MKILITGGTGFIGQAVCEALGHQGHELVVITRNPDQARCVIPAPHQALKWDFLNTEPLQDTQALQNIDAVIHLAGESILGQRWTTEYKDRLYRSRVTATENLIETLKKHSQTFPKVFLSASAIGYYGDRGDEVLEESAQPGAGFLAQICQDWEKALEKLPQGSTRSVALRIGIVLGQGGGALKEMLGPFSLGVGGPLGGGSQWMSWIHLNDLVKIILESLHRDSLSGPVNCCSAQPVRNREFTQTLAKSLRTHAWIPAPKLGLQAALGEGSCALLSSQRVEPKKLKDAHFTFEYPTLDLALDSIFSDNEACGLSELKQKCWIPLPIESVFEFFSDARNLEKITPPWLHFKILGQSSEQIQAGTTIDYQLKLHGIPLRWRTEISSWNPPHEFTDTQLKGPYRVWKHTHRFSPLRGGTLMEDRVLYQIPMGYLGKLVAGSWVKGDVTEIFRYRNTTIFDLLLKKA